MGGATNLHVQFQHKPLDIVRIGLLLLLPITAIIFARDIFAVNTAIGRFTLFEIVSVVFLTIAVIDLRAYALTRAATLVVTGMLAFGITGIISTVVLLWTDALPQPGLAFIDSLRYCLFGAILLTAAQYLRDDKLRRYYALTWVGITGLVTAIAIAQGLAVAGVSLFEQFFYWENIRWGRVAGTLRWQGPFTAFMGLGLPLIAALLAKGTSYREYAGYGLIFVGGIIAIGFSGSRSGLLMLPLALLPLVLTLNTPKRAMAAILAAIPTSAATYYFTPTHLIERYVDRVTSTILAPQEMDRVVRWQEAIELWVTDSLLVGMGPRQMRFILDHYPHSSYVGIIADRGLLGLLAMLLFVAGLCYISYGLFTNRHADGAHWAFNVGLATGVGNILLYGISAEGFSYRMTAVFLIIALAVHDASSDESRLQVHLATLWEELTQNGR